MMDDSLVVVSVDPLNCETSVSALIGGTVMPSAHFYIRNHFAVPALDADRWRLHIRGLVGQPLSLGLRDLVNLPAQTITVTLECAGNGRSFLTPPVAGEQWALGAVSTAQWTGVPLHEVLDRVGVLEGAREAVFKGADGVSGGEPGSAKRFERSLTLDEIRESDPLLAYAMNGAPLPDNHGFPLRLIVPGWYGIASVKWLTEIELIDHQFGGYFQKERYVYEWAREGHTESEPVRRQRVRALVTQPGAGQTVPVGPLAIRGLAWSGVAPIARVEVSIDDGAWEPARLLGSSSTFEWQRWELIRRVDRAGLSKIRARATDQAGRTQPDQPEWNRLGYGNNAVHELSFEVEAAPRGTA